MNFNFISPLISIFFPLYSTKSFDEMIESLGMIPTNKKQVLICAFSLFWCASVPFKGFILPFISNKYIKLLSCYEKNAIGQVGIGVYVAAGFGMSEMLLLRLWTLNYFFKNGKRRPDFLKLTDISPETTKMQIIFGTKLMSFIVSTAAATTLVGLVYLSMESYSINNNNVGLIFSIFWLFVSFLGPYYAVPDVNTMFNIAILSYKNVDKQTDKVIKYAFKSHVYDEDVEQLLLEYSKVMLMIKQFNQIGRMFILLTKTIVIPDFATGLFILTIQPQSFGQLFLQYFAFTTSLLFCLRGYIFIFLLGGIHAKSKTLHEALMTMIVREKVNLKHRLMLTFILDDLTSGRVLFSISEYGNQIVNRIDFFASLFGTMQVIILAFDFSYINKFD